MQFDNQLTKRVTSFMYGVYGWMACALALTALTSYYVATMPAIFTYIHSNPIILFALFIEQIALVICITMFLPRMNFAFALGMFLLYAMSLGLTLSIIFFIYTTGSIVSTFVATAGMFGIMALYGYITRTDLTTMGSISIMALFGLIIALIINLFLRNPFIDLVLSGVGVVIFALLTAYDTQKIKQLGRELLIDGRQEMRKVALLGALTLYLDFINLFLFLLRFMGKQREK